MQKGMDNLWGTQSFGDLNQSQASAGEGSQLEQSMSTMMTPEAYSSHHQSTKASQALIPPPHNPALKDALPKVSPNPTSQQPPFLCMTPPSSVSPNSNQKQDEPLFPVPSASGTQKPSFLGTNKAEVGNFRGEIVSLQITVNPLVMVLQTKTQDSYTRRLTTQYVEYLEKYFFHNFNLLLPTIAPNTLETPSGHLFAKVHFDFLRQTYPQQLLDFLANSAYETPQTPQATLVSKEDKRFLQNKISQYKNYFVSAISTGKGMVQSTINKIKGESSAPLQLLENLFQKQLVMAIKHSEARKQLEKVCDSTIFGGIYESGDRAGQQEILVSLRWLIGFTLTFKKVKDLQLQSDDVLRKKLDRQLQTFHYLHTQQTTAKRLLLQQALKRMFP